MGQQTGFYMDENRSEQVAAQVSALPVDSPISERDAALCLHMVTGLGPRTFSKLIETFGSAAAVLNAAPSTIREVPGVSQTLVRKIATCRTDSNFLEQVQICADHGIDVYDQTSESYPAALKEIPDPPPILFSQGVWQPQDQIAIGIVGSRHATPYGLRIADRLARELSYTGFTIVSGLARGIDAAAHRAALKAGGRTIAVLGGGILTCTRRSTRIWRPRFANRESLCQRVCLALSPRAVRFRVATEFSLEFRWASS